MAATLMVTACSPKTSAERHARQYVYAADDGFNPNFYVKKADSIRMMVPFFRQFHDEGVKNVAPLQGERHCFAVPMVFITSTPICARLQPVDCVTVKHCNLIHHRSKPPWHAAKPPENAGPENTVNLPSHLTPLTSGTLNAGWSPFLRNPMMKTPLSFFTTHLKRP
ncbi:Exc2 family lipoprotein [Salmonella enterica]